jgi:hypothetical protein
LSVISILPVSSNQGVFFMRKIISVLFFHTKSNPNNSSFSFVSIRFFNASGLFSTVCFSSFDISIVSQF